MSGGLRHQNDEKKRPSYLVGYKLADKASHPVEGTQCICAEASGVLELMKFIIPNTLTGADVLRDVEKRQFTERFLPFLSCLVDRLLQARFMRLRSAGLADS
jgi:hypothetical protein